ncbi:peptidase [Nocardioides guangzhouensis]|uniref:Peptidase n=1 Tax=Nocardioides guangzhouensis TaxID=2497878 RepID=A0A4Q4ZI20_9ACTN|nr:neutral zinc metallopeptidase [Nocardioides guangzhouensis]RYP87515.1 peptidase [Nocardioides guangzhouensis]
MRFNPKARLDTGQVSDTGRGGGGLGGGGMRLPIPGGAAAGGGIGGIIVLVLFVVLVSCVGGGLPGGTSGSASGLDPSQVQDAGGDTGRYDHCKTGEDANNDPDCARVAVVNSVQDYWSDALPAMTGVAYQEAETHTFTEATSTGCGQASSQVGPFYCPQDDTVYEDTGFFDEVLEKQLGGPDGGFVEAYVLGHEYGHHIQDLTGTMGQVRSQQGANSDAVRLELQADCYAGMWARNATGTEDATGQVLISELTDEDIRLAIEAAEAVGDDRIQRKTSGRVNPESWTHGSAEQRQKWFMIGYRSGDYRACDTFSVTVL